jgi:hypothetical protein
MASRFGLLTLFDSDREYVNTVGQEIVYEWIQRTVARWNADLQLASSVFVSGQTQNFKTRYKLPGGGHLQRTRQQSGPGAVKTYGYWDVAFPLEEFGNALADNEVDLAYMTAGDLATHMSTIFTQATNTYRYEMLRRLLNNTQVSFVDERKGTLSIEPLANGDSVVYPPILGAEAGAVEDHYLETGYLVSAISDTNNPLITGRDELEEHFGSNPGGENIVALCSKDVSDELVTLTGFTEIPDQFIRYGDNTDIPVGLPTVPGKIRGRHSGVWVVEWRWLPTTYTIFLHLGEEPPLRERVDEAGTGLTGGLQLVANDELYPLHKATWRWRFGLGTAQRLNGVVIEVASGGTYTIPTGYTY